MGPATVPLESTVGTPTALSGFPGLLGTGAQAGLHPDLPVPALSTSPCAGVTGRCGKLGDKTLTAFPQGLLTARGAEEVFPGTWGCSQG